MRRSIRERSAHPGAPQAGGSSGGGRSLAPPATCQDRAHRRKPGMLGRKSGCSPLTPRRKRRCARQHPPMLAARLQWAERPISPSPRPSGAAQSPRARARTCAINADLGWRTPSTRALSLSGETATEPVLAEGVTECEQNEVAGIQRGRCAADVKDVPFWIGTTVDGSAASSETALHQRRRIRQCRRRRDADARVRVRPVRLPRPCHRAARGFRRSVFQSVSACADGTLLSLRGVWLGFRARPVLFLSEWLRTPVSNSARNEASPTEGRTGDRPLRRRRAAPAARARVFGVSRSLACG
jgi:hypothetical protein